MIPPPMAALHLALGPIILVGVLVVVLPVGICMLCSLIYFLQAWSREHISPGRKALALTWSFSAPVLMGIPAVALILSDGFVGMGWLIFLLMLVQPCLICRLVLRYNFKRSLMSILCIYGPAAAILLIILLRLLWGFGRMAESVPF